MGVASPATNGASSTSCDVTARFAHGVTSPPGRLDCAHAVSISAVRTEYRLREQRRQHDNDEDSDVALLLQLTTYIIYSPLHDDLEPRTYCDSTAVYAYFRLSQRL